MWRVWERGRARQDMFVATAGYFHHLFGLKVMGFQIIVAQRPILANAVKAAKPEVIGM